MLAMGRPISMFLSKNIFVAALIALLCMMKMLHVSAFAPPSCTTVSRDVSCNVFGNRNKKTTSSSKKTAPAGTERLRKSGIGGMNTFKPKTAAKKAPVKKSSVKNAATVKKQPTGSVFDVKMSEETPIGTILISFLIPWRNPNSIFLYMLIIVSVLGKMNEQ